MRPATPTVAVTVEPMPVEAVAEPGWRDSILAEDEAALAALAEHWSASRAAVARGRHAELEKEGQLLTPDGGQDHAALPPGSYNCRVVRLGRTAGRAGIAPFPPQFCFVRGEAGGRLSFEKQTGSDLPTGWLFPDGDRRYVFLGTQRLRAGRPAAGYGRDRSRDVAGVVERVGLFRWRLVVPRSDPQGLWVYELTPVPEAQQPS